MSKNILVTGGAGFIGSHTVVALAAAGYNPIILDDFSNSEPAVIANLGTLLGKQPTLYDQDYTDNHGLASILEREAIDGIIHFAAFKQVGGSIKEPLSYYRNNVSGLIGLLEAAEECGVRSVVFSSSATVYGEPDVLPISEDSPLKPATSPYGATKQMGELILRDACAISTEFSAIALRYFNPIGAHESALIGELPIGVPANLVPFITQTAAGLRKSLTVFGGDYPTLDGSCIRDYIHVMDLAEAHVKALAFLYNQTPGSFETCNIGTGIGSSVLGVIKEFEKVSGVKLNYSVGPRRNGDIVSCYAAVDKAHQLLGWSANKTLSEALADAWRWQQTL